jgi:integrase
LSNKTLETYEYLLNGRILKEFGHMKLDQIKTMHIVTFLDSLEGLSSATIKFHYRVLKDILKRAKEWKMIKENPVDGVSTPKVTNKEGDVYTEDEVIELFSLLENELIHWRIMIKLAITVGLRRGELLGLQWEDIDLEQNTISLNHALTHNKTDGYVLKEPKTKTSKRTVSVPPSIMKDLKAYKVTKMKERIQAAELWKGGEHFFVFSNWDGKPFYPSGPTRWWTRFTKRVGFRFIRFHDLRHTSATLLINRGVHAKIISNRLGHADIRTTMNIYGHALRTADEGAADKFEDILSSKKSLKIVPDLSPK